MYREMWADTEAQSNLAGPTNSTPSFNTTADADWFAPSNPAAAPLAFIDETDSQYQFIRGLAFRRLFSRSSL